MTHTGRSPRGGPYGRRLYVNVVDETAKANPDGTWIYAPRSSDPKDGWKPITWRQHANAVNRTASWLVEKLGKPEHKAFPAIAYVGPNDVRYLILFAACAKAGYQVMFPSPRNNTESQVLLLQGAKCQRILYGEDYAKRVRPWSEEASVDSLPMLSLNKMFHESAASAYPYDETFESAEFDPIIILHTSGSTGNPKPIYCNQGLFCSADNYHNLATLDGLSYFIEAMAVYSKRSYCPLPLFHAFGLYVCISTCTFWQKPLALGYGDRPLTAESVVDGMEAAGCDALILPPSIVEDIYMMKDGLAKLQKLSYVLTGSGAISKDIGDTLVAHDVKFNNVISTTEYGFYPVYWQENRSNWDWFIFDNDQFGCRYDHVDDNIYEQTIVRKEPHQPIFYTLPDAKEYKTGDLFEKHPTLPHHWRSRGRVDNIIVFSNGEKLNPVSLEAAVTLHPEVRQALVVGDGQFQAGMILEPALWPMSDAEQKAFIERVWPTIEKANAATVEHGRIAHHLVSISDPERPFLFSPKGSFRRGAVIKLYKDDIAALYSADDTIAPVDMDIATKHSLANSLTSIFSKILPGGTIEHDEDFFLLGADSLQIINTAKRITSGLKAAGVVESKATLVPRDIYSHSTISGLSSFLHGRIHGSGAGGVTATGDVLRRLYGKYCVKQFDNSSKPPAKTKERTIVLTGSTGSLGSYFLHFLISSPTVSRIFCLNRSEDGGRSKQLAGNKERGLSTDFTKVTFSHADLCLPDLGLGEETYAEVLQSVDYIIHNAWPVNFNMAVQSFESQICGVHQLVGLLQKTAVKASITFISSVGTADQWSKSTPVPEANLTDFELAAMGYGQSKQVSSMILDDAAKLGLPASVVRLGQVAGPTTTQGVWNRQEWLPTIVESSVKLGILPDSLGDMQVDWVPVDQVARTIIELADFTSVATDFNDGAKWFNLVNPSVTSWRKVAPAMVSFYEHKGKQLKLVQIGEWIKAVESAPASLNLSAVKLMDTYKSMEHNAKHGHSPAFETVKAQQVSKTLAGMCAITPELVKLWCQQWDFAA